LTRIVGITGIVASGKTTYAGKLAEALRAEGKTVEIVSSDGFLLPKREMEELGLLNEKGSPRSHDITAMKSFVKHVKHDTPARFPQYSHELYDRVPGEMQELPSGPKRVDLVIFEGVGVVAVADLLDELMFLDVSVDTAHKRYLTRVLGLFESGRNDSASWFYTFKNMTTGQFVSQAESVWEDVNLPNYEKYIAPFRKCATLVE
jgi:type I pantothenate kinase